jgi:hypothetical protein
MSELPYKTGDKRMRQHYDKIVTDTEKRVARFLKHQIRDESSPDYGGLVEDLDYADPVKATIFYLGSLAALYYTPESRFYHDAILMERVREALDYVTRMIRPDGTFDFHDSNFYSAPDTAFNINRLVFLYRIIEKYGLTTGNSWLREKLYRLISKAGSGMTGGGFHTPNHRWAIAAALISCSQITGIAEFASRAAHYLNEGIDCNVDGEYAERSAGNYNVVNNEQMIILFRETGDEQYLEYVRRNLELSLRYIDPDGSIFTNNSTRWDYGMKRYPEYYYYQYLFLAWKLNLPEFAAAAARIMDDLVARGDLAPDCLDWYLLYPELIEYPLGCAAFPEDYEAFYPQSGIVRVRRGNYSFSLIQGNARFLYFQVGSLTLQLKIGVSYFDQREFSGQTLGKTAAGYRLIYKAHGWYYLPFETKPATTDWWQMDNQSRSKLHGPDLELTVTVTEVAGGIDVAIVTTGCDRVPLKIEMAVTAGALVQTAAFVCPGSAGEAIIIKEGTVEVTKGLDTILVGPAFARHNFVGGKDGAEPPSGHHYTLYFTDYTNFSRTIRIQAKA